MEEVSRKYIFLDIDGTIYAKPGVIPESAKKAIRQARRNGHQIFLCTGRNKKEVEKAIWDIGIDGMVGSAGAYVEYHDEIIFNEHLDKQDLKELYLFLEQHNIVFAVETNDSLCGTKDNTEKQLVFFKKVFAGMEREKESLALFESILKITDDIYSLPGVNKVLTYDSDIPLADIRDKFGDRFTVIPSSLVRTQGESAEIYSARISKATGMEKLEKKLGIPREDMIAFGDGANDFEMIAYAGTGVAMGNGIEALKQQADMVTKEAIQDGLYQGFQMCGLIETAANEGRKQQ